MRFHTSQAKLHCQKMCPPLFAPKYYLKQNNLNLKFNMGQLQVNKACLIVLIITKVIKNCQGCHKRIDLGNIFFKKIYGKKIINYFDNFFFMKVVLKFSKIVY